MARKIIEICNELDLSKISDFFKEYCKVECRTYFELARGRSDVEVETLLVDMQDATRAKVGLSWVQPMQELHVYMPAAFIADESVTGSTLIGAFGVLSGIRAVTFIDGGLSTYRRDQNFNFFVEIKDKFGVVARVFNFKFQIISPGIAGPGDGGKENPGSGETKDWMI